MSKPIGDDNTQIYGECYHDPRQAQALCERLNAKEREWIALKRETLEDYVKGQIAEQLAQVLLLEDQSPEWVKVMIRYPEMQVSHELVIHIPPRPSGSVDVENLFDSDLAENENMLGV